MKIHCDKAKLAEAVSNVQRAVSAKTPIPALEGVLLKAQEDSVTLYGYDLELGITTSIPASVDEPGSTVLSAKLFGDIVRRLPHDSVTVAVDGKNMAEITCGPSRFSVVGMPAEEYPETPIIDERDNVTLPRSVLKSMIRQTLFAVADNDAKPIHTGTLFELGENKVKLVSVDGYRLAVREEAAACSLDTSFVVPGKTLGEVLKLLGEDDEGLTLSVGKRHILFNIGAYTVVSRLLEGEFLDYRSAIPASHATRVLVNTREFIESVERVSLLITDRLKSPVRCVFEEGEIRLSCSTPVGRASDMLKADIDGDPVEMGFNNRYLLDALRNTEGDEASILLNGPLSPMKVMPREGDSFLFLVLPVRLKND